MLVDTLHVGRSSTTLDDLRDIPREWIHYAQLCDGSVPVPKGWPHRYAARRIAWHVLDHAWEMEDRAG